MRKRLFEILLTPLVIAFVGCLGTYFITRQQIKSAELQSRTQIESTEKITKSDQQIKIIEIFSEKIISKDLREREMAVRILGTIDPELARKLIEAIAMNTKEDTIIKEIAKQIISDESLTGSSFAVLGSYKYLEEAINAGKELLSKNTPYEIHIYKGTNSYFAVCLGGHLSFQEAQQRAEYARKYGLSDDVYVRTNEKWKENLFK